MVAKDENPEDQADSNKDKNNAEAEQQEKDINELEKEEDKQADEYDQNEKVSL